MKCPNCQAEMLTWAHVRLRACTECGALWESEDTVLFVPRRSRPAVPVELPTNRLDTWWWDDLRKTFILVTGADAQGQPLAKRAGEAHAFWVQPGLYVRAEPPIVAQPELPKDEDAAMLRSLADGWSGKWPKGGEPLPSEDDLRRIAARLEKERSE